MSTYKFSEDLKKFAKNADPEIVVKKVAMDLFQGVILRTPVKTGRARANWQTSIGTPKKDTLESTDQNRALVEIRSTVEKLKPDQTIFLANNLPYIEVLENGSSQQAPNGMVKVTLAEYPHILEDAVKR